MSSSVAKEGGNHLPTPPAPAQANMYRSGLSTEQRQTKLVSTVHQTTGETANKFTAKMALGNCNPNPKFQIAIP